MVYAWEMPLARSPLTGLRLITLVGTGVQLLCMLLFTLVIACLGMLSPGTFS